VVVAAAAVAVLAVLGGMAVAVAAVRMRNLWVAVLCYKNYRCESIMCIQCSATVPSALGFDFVAARCHPVSTRSHHQGNIRGRSLKVL
jgi:hypothetical protein